MRTNVALYLAGIFEVIDFIGAPSRNRTGTTRGREILSLLRLPIPPWVRGAAMRLSARVRPGSSCNLAEAVRFELTDGLPHRWFSRPVHSTALARFHFRDGARMLKVRFYRGFIGFSEGREFSPCKASCGLGRPGRLKKAGLTGDNASFEWPARSCYESGGNFQTRWS